MGNSISTGLGGVSKVFPIGTFVRVPRKLTDEEIKAAEGSNCAWTSEMDSSVGPIGIVLGGGVKVESDMTSVGFMVPNGSVLGDWWNYQSNWLEAVYVDQVPNETRESLRKYMMDEMRKVLLHTLKENCSGLSKFGAAGTLVQVCSTKPADTDSWSFVMDRTLNQIGIVVGDTGESHTIVVFPEPVFYRYLYDDVWLSKAHEQSLDDLTLLPQKYESLSKLRQVLFEAVQQHGNDSSDAPAASRRESIDQRFAAHEARIAALENERIVARSSPNVSDAGNV
jgi:hypothetical protein